MNRDTMLAYIDGLASDDDLMKLCTILRNGKDAEKLTIAVLSSFKSSDVDTQPELPIDAHSSGSNFDKPERKNINPGPSAIGKLGEKTKVIILDCLQKQVQPDEKYKEHLKLLWARGEVKWDGEVWYV